MSGHLLLRLAPGDQLLCTFHVNLRMSTQERNYGESRCFCILTSSPERFLGSSFPGPGKNHGPNLTFLEMLHHC